VVGRLLGEVDDIVQGGRKRVTVVGRERARAASGAAVQAVDDVVGDAVALLLAEQQVARELVALGPRGQQVAQEQRRSLDVAARFLEQVEGHGVRCPPQKPH
jgi:hypothetical protein